MEEIAVVIPCYRGETTLKPLIDEILPFTKAHDTVQGVTWKVTEIVLVFDGGSNELADEIEKLTLAHKPVRAVWLSRNFGQHAATLAGISTTTSRWVATLDEDCQHNPTELGLLLDHALANRKLLVYGKPTNPPHHGLLRNGASKMAKAIAAWLIGTKRAKDFQSYRLISGDVARSLAQRVGPQVYLDVALAWVTDEPGLAAITLRDSSHRRSGYSPKKLFAHFWALFLSIGTRTMRVVSFLGIFSALFGIGLAVFFIIQRLSGASVPEGWASQITVTLVSGGLILFFLGLISEYLASNSSSVT